MTIIRQKGPSGKIEIRFFLYGTLSVFCLYSNVIQLRDLWDLGIDKVPYFLWAKLFQLDMLGMCGYKDVCQIPKINYWLFKIYVGLVLAWIYKLKINYWFVDFKSGSYPCDVASRVLGWICY